MVTRGLEVEKVVDEVLDHLDVVTEPGAQDEHPPRVLHRVELEVVHAVPTKQVMPQQGDHPLHDPGVPVQLRERGEEGEQSLLLPCDWRLL